MSFNSSCAWAGLANLLEQYGVETEDRELAMEAGLPWLFSKEDDAFVTGAMLQNAGWFDLCLRPKGFHMKERALLREELGAWLKRRPCAMLGVQLQGVRHALIYTGTLAGEYRFLNNKWRESTEPELMIWDEEELLAAVPERVTVGELEPCPASEPDRRERYRASLETLEELRAGLAAFCAEKREPEEMLQALDPLLRAPLLDALTMAQISGQSQLADELQTVQGQLMGLLRENRPAVPAQVLDLPLLNRALDRIRAGILSRI